MMDLKKLAGMIDHTYLKADTDAGIVARICQEARTWNFATVCLPPYFVPTAVQSLEGSPVGVCTVIGFPLGYNQTRIKALEAEWASEQGASDIDMVINVAAIKSGHWLQVKEDIAQVRKACEGRVLKVILETCYLDNPEIEAACHICLEAGADFVKSSTGFGSHGATLEHITLMRSTVGTDRGVKASGGIRNREQALAMIQAGANRLGTSAGVLIMTQDDSTMESRKDKDNY